MQEFRSLRAWIILLQKRGQTESVLLLVTSVHNCGHINFPKKFEVEMRESREGCSERNEIKQRRLNVKRVQVEEADTYLIGYVTNRES